jgi:hypothetical protein
MVPDGNTLSRNGEKAKYYWILLTIRIPADRSKMRDGRNKEREKKNKGEEIPAL